MSTRFIRALSAATLVAALCAADAAAAEDNGNPLSAIGRMFGNDRQNTSTTGQEQSEGPTTDQVLRIDNLESQLRRMTGQVEELQYRNQQLENQIRSMGGTPGGAPGAAANGGPAIPQGPPPQNALTQQAPRAPIQSSALPQNPSYLPPQRQPGYSPPPQPGYVPPPAGGRRADVFDPNANPNAPGAPRALGSPQNEPPPPVAERSGGTPMDLSGPGGQYGGGRESGPLPAPPSRSLSSTGAMANVAPPAAAETPKASYDVAYGYLQRKDYPQAEQAFQAFIKRYPTDRRATDAQYWLGESLFQRHSYDAAAQAFLDVSTKHAGYPKAPEALLRLAQSLSAMKQKEMSCATLAEVGRKYPKASASVKQGVEREQKRAHC